MSGRVAHAANKTKRTTKTQRTLLGGADFSAFVAQEIHSLHIPFWKDLVFGLDDSLLVGGYVRVPDKPGLGVELNYDAIEEHLRPWSSLFGPSDDWDQPKLERWIPKG